MRRLRAPCAVSGSRRMEGRACRSAAANAPSVREDLLDPGPDPPLSGFMAWPTSLSAFSFVVNQVLLDLCRCTFKACSTMCSSCRDHPTCLDGGAHTSWPRRNM